MSLPGDVPSGILERLRAICRALPESYEEPAWIGVRWRIRQRTFAHVYSREDRVLMTFRAGDDLEALVAGGPPFAKADWGTNVVLMSMTGSSAKEVDWAEVEELLTESYRLQAPKRLTQGR